MRAYSIFSAEELEKIGTELYHFSYAPVTPGST